MTCAAGNAPVMRRRFRQALLEGSDVLSRGATRLEQGHRTLVDTENLGNDILASLQRQRQQIKNAQCVLKLGARLLCAASSFWHLLPSP